MTVSTTPKVSVVLTTYKRASTLGETLDSILAQSLDDFELIVSDDRSPDHTAELVKDYARRDPRVRYRCNAANLKMPGNLNAGIAEARGEYVANLHDGDVYRPDLLEKWAGALDRNPSAAFVFNQYLIVRYADGREQSQLSSVFDLPECVPGPVFLRDVYANNRWGCPVWGTVMARRACYEAVGPFDAQYSFVSDVEMWLRLASRYDVAYVAEPLMTLTPREAGHLMTGHHIWGLATDVRLKRQALKIVNPRDYPTRLAFELHARAHYGWIALLELKKRRVRGFLKGVAMMASGRDLLPPPY